MSQARGTYVRGIARTFAKADAGLNCPAIWQRNVYHKDSMSTKLPFQQHPYFPPSLQLPSWQPLVLPFDRILAVFFGAAGAIGLLAFFLAGD